MALMALDGIVIDDSNQYTREEFEECTLDENQKEMDRRLTDL